MHGRQSFVERLSGAEDTKLHVAAVVIAFMTVSAKNGRRDFQLGNDGAEDLSSALGDLFEGDHVVVVVCWMLLLLLLTTISLTKVFNVIALKIYELIPNTKASASYV